jgi:soluble lytic murein transglycosylase-like protein
MHPRRRANQPHWERRAAYPRHPVGRARRRWPRAYDGGHDLEGPSADSRYRRSYDADEALPPKRRRGRRSSGMQRLRDSPVRNGLIGLAIAGAAAPIAVNRYQQALRTDPAHERVAIQQQAADMVNDQTVAEEWQRMVLEGRETANIVGEAGVVNSREVAIQESMERYSEYNLSRDLAETIHDAAAEAGIDPEIAFGLVRAESSFRNTATSVVGAVGLTQLMPRTAAWMEPGITTSQLRDPATNLRVGMKYLNYLMKKYNGNEDLALLAYNRGPGTVDRALKRGANPDNGYADFVRGKENHGHQLFTAR